MEQCAWCKKEFSELFMWDLDGDWGWCSEECVQAAEERGIQQWESQQED